jgi:hypothetical protein
LTELSGAACASLSDQVGDKFPTVFRSKVSESGLSEAMSIQMPLGSLFISAAFDETFAGKNQVGTGSFIIDAFRSALPDAVFDLKFRPAVVTESVSSFKFKGTWKNYRVEGCTAKVRGNFVKRVVP